MENLDYLIGLPTITDNVVPTCAYKKIFKICDDTKDYHDVNVISGVPGLGKTTGIVSYKKKNIDTVYIITAEKSSNASIFYWSLVNLFGNRPYKSTLHKHFIIKMAAELFVRQEKNILLIIDQANKLTSDDLEHLHGFRDKTKINTGIILSGTPVFEKNLLKWVEAERSGMAEIKSRINEFYSLPEPSENDIISIIRANGIQDSKFERESKNLTDFRLLEFQINNYFKYQKQKKQTPN